MSHKSLSEFKHVLVVGGGLIGSSFIRACREKNAISSIWVMEQDPVRAKRLEDLAISDRVLGADEHSDVDLAAIDLVLLAVPPAKMTSALEPLLPYLSTKCLISDVGSIKEKIMQDINSILPKGMEFIGGHPIAGTENSGPDAGYASLFEDRWCILTPQDQNTDAAQNLKALWQILGSEVAFMEAARHDLVLATTSHLPHLIAYALVGTATDMETVTKNEVVKYSAGGFRDFTRIAASDPHMWRDVFLGNKDAVLEVLERYIEDLTAMKKSIRWGEGDVLLEQFTKARGIRERIVDAGQETDVSNFGRGGDGQNDEAK